MDSEKFEYFMTRTEKDLNHIKGRVDRLWDFRILLIGASITISIVCSTIISLASIYFGAR